jgi:tetratricopeptide (TPR) repeat protein
LVPGSSSERDVPPRAGRPDPLIGSDLGETTSPRVIGFASPATGTGRTGIIATVGAALAATKNRVLILDCCPGQITLHDYLRPFYLEPMETRSPGDGRRSATLEELQQMSAGSRRNGAGDLRPPVQARYTLPMGLGELTVIPMNEDVLGESGEGGRTLRAVLHGLPFDYVLIDYPAGMEDATAAHVAGLCDTAALCYTPQQTRLAGAFLRALRARGGPSDLCVVAVPTVPSHDVDERWQPLPSLETVAGPPDEWPMPAGEAPAAEAPKVTTVPLALKGYQMLGFDQVIPIFVEEQPEALEPYAALVAALTDGAVAGLPVISPLIRLRYRRAYRFPTDNAPDIVTLVYANADRPWADWLAARLRRGGLEVQELEPGGRPAGRTRCVISSTHLEALAPIWSALREMVVESAGDADLVWITVEDDGPAPPGIPAMTIDLAGAPTATPESTIFANFGIGRQSEPPAGEPRLPVPPDHQTLSLPARNPAFVGREDVLMDLRDQLLGEGPRRLTYGGGAGIGKSEVVREYAYRFAYDYDVVWWVPAQDLQSVLGSLTGLAAELKIKNRADAPRAAVDALDAPGAPRSLIIYDNADDPAVLDGLMPSGSACHVLITSRRPDAGAQPVQLGVFRQAESVAMLTKRVPGLPDALAVRVADAVDNLPLALRMASAWMRETIPYVRRNMNVSELRVVAWVSDELIQRLESVPLEFPESMLHSSQVRTVARVLSIVLSTMKAADLHLTVRLAELAAFLSPDGASLNLLRSRPILRLLADEDHAEPENGVELRPSQVAADEGYVDVVLWSGTRYGLFEVDWGWRGQVRIHRAVQDLLKGAMNGERSRRRSQIQRALADYAPTDPQVEEATHVTVLEELQRHFEYCEATLATEDKVRHWVTKQIRYLYRLRDRTTWDSALVLAQKAESAWLASGVAADDPLLRRLRKELANLHRTAGNDATALVIDEALLAADPNAELKPSLESLRERRNLGGDMRGMGRFAEALAHDTLVYDGLRRLLGRDHRDTLMSQHNKAISTFLAGQPWKALQIEEEAHRAYLRLMGPTELRVWWSLSDIGLYQRELGRLTDAMATLQEAQTGIRRVRGLDNRNHVDVLRIRRNIEVTERCLAQPGFSPAKLVEVTRSYEDVLGRNHPDTRACRLSLAAAYRAEGQIDLAVSTAADCYQSYERDLADRHPFRSACLVDLSAYRLAQGDVPTATRQAWTAHEGLVVRLGPDHYWSIAAAVNLALCQRSAGLTDEATRLLTKTVEAARLALPRDHPYTIAARTNLARLNSDAPPNEWVTLDIDIPST